ncbi:MAG TPA: enterobactin ABC transporter permease, partial [Staphylococcus sp.]|nr:enterobactin ABC transporter permease [Staphylococcus sp.]
MTKNHNVYRHVVIWFLVLLFAIGISLFVGSTGITWKFDNQLEWTIFYKLRVP